MATSKDRGPSVELEEVSDITPHNKALYEAGKKLLVDSVDVGREFCKFMTTTTIGAIPIYIALLKLVLPKDYSLQSSEALVFLAPPVLFLTAAVVFVIGYFPKRGSLSLDLPSEIERERSRTIRRRHGYSLFAFSVFCVGILLSSWILINRLAV
ncbi:hypothetical protein [Halorhodospira halophila]|uniref:hypothetical protein n=1 Tax=Halorhodospira halophila TaxID=1053 RepID=UPI0019147B8F|nr:hypothetical protein [Halorhodospira halophila]